MVCKRRLLIQRWSWVGSPTHNARKRAASLPELPFRRVRHAPSCPFRNACWLNALSVWNIDSRLDYDDPALPHPRADLVRSDTLLPRLRRPHSAALRLKFRRARATSEMDSTLPPPQSRRTTHPMARHQAAAQAREGVSDHLEPRREDAEEPAHLSASEPPLKSPWGTRTRHTGSATLAPQPSPAARGDFAKTPPSKPAGRNGIRYLTPAASAYRDRR